MDDEDFLIADEDLDGPAAHDVLHNEAEQRVEMILPELPPVDGGVVAPAPAAPSPKRHREEGDEDGDAEDPHLNDSDGKPVAPESGTKTKADWCSDTCWDAAREVEKKV